MLSRISKSAFIASVSRALDEKAEAYVGKRTKEIAFSLLEDAKEDEEDLNEDYFAKKAKKHLASQATAKSAAKAAHSKSQAAAAAKKKPDYFAKKAQSHSKATDAAKAAIRGKK